MKKRTVLTTEMKAKKEQGYTIVVTYNDTDKFLVFKDKFFKSEKSAYKFFNNLNTHLKEIYCL